MTRSEQDDINKGRCPACGMYNLALEQETPLKGTVSCRSCENVWRVTLYSGRVQSADRVDEDNDTKH